MVNVFNDAGGPVETPAPGSRARTGTVDLTLESLERHDHACAFGDGNDDYVSTVARVLARTGPSDLVVASGRVDSTTPTGVQVLRDGFASGRLMLLHPADTYVRSTGDAGVATETAYEAVFDRIVQAAIADGFRGVRVVADNTTALAGVSARDRADWFAWEHATDVWQLERPVTGLCWFDRSHLTDEDATAVMRCHARVEGASASWRVFHRTGADGATVLAVAGDLEAADVDAFGAVVQQAVVALERHSRQGLPRLVTVDLADVGYLHHRALDVLAAAAGRDGRVRLTSASRLVRRLHDRLDWWPQLQVA